MLVTMVVTIVTIATVVVGITMQWPEAVTPLEPE